MSVVDTAPFGACKAKRRSPSRRRRAGFTLVEMLVVLAIIGLISALVGPRLIGQLTESRERAAELQIRAFSSALDIFFIDVGRYPTQSEGLRALVEAPSGARSWSGPYLRGGAGPLDPWGQEYRYSADGGSYTIVTMGPDGVGATQ